MKKSSRKAARKAEAEADHAAFARRPWSQQIKVEVHVEEREELHEGAGLEDLAREIHLEARPGKKDGAQTAGCRREESKRPFRVPEEESAAPGARDEEEDSAADQPDSR